MDKEEIKEMIQDVATDIVESRFESFAKTTLEVISDSHKKYHTETIKTIDEKLDSNIEKAIGKYVNGKIDKLTLMVQGLDIETKPAVTTVSFARTFGIVLLWVCGAIISVGGATLVLINLFK